MPRPLARKRARPAIASSLDAPSCPSRQCIINGKLPEAFFDDAKNISKQVVKKQIEMLSDAEKTTLLEHLQVSRVCLSGPLMQHMARPTEQAPNAEAIQTTSTCFVPL